MKPFLFFGLALLAVACGSRPDDDFSVAPGREYSGRIAEGLMRLGASDARSRCFSERLSRSDRDTAADATRIVEESADRDDMRQRVLKADGETTRAFISAKFGCTLDE